MQWIVSLVFGLLASFTLAFAMQSLRARSLPLNTIPPEERGPVRDGLNRSAWMNDLMGISFTVATMLAWWNLPLALVVGGWPILRFAVLLATGRVSFLSRLSTGEE